MRVLIKKFLVYEVENKCVSVSCPTESYRHVTLSVLLQLCLSRHLTGMPAAITSMPMWCSSLPVALEYSEHTHSITACSVMVYHLLILYFGQNGMFFFFSRNALKGKKVVAFMWSVYKMSVCTVTRVYSLILCV